MSRARDIADLGNEASGGLTSSDISDLNDNITPHIIPGVLYPAISGKLLDGSTSHSGNYGTAQSDGRSYFYTDIKGSRPIHDSRVGSHFGSQRHKFKSLQLLEQETATHGDDVFSIDGREWCRAVGGSDAVVIKNDDDGHYIQTQSTAGTIEITGYFNAVNLLSATWMTSTNTVLVAINGVTAHSAFALNGATATPLGGRYVDQSSVYNIDITSSSSLSADTSLGINTIKIKHVTGDSKLHGIELIAQDTSNRNNIQIPSQDVVSYGKKFTVSGTPHYDPFNGFVNGTSLHSAFVDTATSLGLDSAPGSSAKWAISSTNHIRPYQGGRVVKWVDSDGTIKTSVNMMPPNAQNISTTADSETTTPSATNTNYKPAFSDDAIDHSQSEVAKTFHFREFGNGGSNQGTGGTYADASMLNTSDDIAYVMDDGLTSFSSDGLAYNSTALNATLQSNGESYYLTFIGTGITIHRLHNSATQDPSNCIAQNLPYGSHILQVKRVTWDTDLEIYIDGVKVRDGAGSGNNLPIGINEATFHQPKRPPIPEDACVIADYMLMADFVPATVHGYEIISKGVRFLDASRDLFYNDSTTISLQHFGGNSDYGQTGGFRAYSAGTAKSYKLPVFGSGCAFRYHAYNDRVTNATFKVDGSAYGSSHSEYVSGNRFDVTNTGAWDTSASDGTFSNDFTTNGTNAEERVGIKDLTISNRVFEASDTTSGEYLIISGMEIITPIHTSLHYTDGNKTNPKTGFETPFLNELVGGDRNLEQHTLVCSPDGKTWDEVTRDTSYIGSCVLSGNNDTDKDGETDIIIFDDWRGSPQQTPTEYNPNFNKDFAIAYDRVICLVDGEYEIYVQTLGHANKITCAIYINTDLGCQQYSPSTDGGVSSNWKGTLVRGDYIQIKGAWYQDQRYNNFTITRL